MNDFDFIAQWYPGHMAKARRLLADAVRGVDFIVEVRDARAPASTHNPDLSPLLERRPRFVALAKADLAEPRATEAWERRLQESSHPAMAISLLDSQCVGELRRRLQRSVARSKSPSHPLAGVSGVRLPKSAANIMKGLVIGMPNTGKSTLIRSLGGGRIRTGARPGVTRNLQWVNVGNGLSLLDTPGIVWPRSTRGLEALKLAWLGLLSDASFDRLKAAKALARWAFAQGWTAFFDRYDLSPSTRWDEEDVLRHIALHRGHLGKRGEEDLDQAAQTLLRECRDGLIGRVTFDPVGN